MMTATQTPPITEPAPVPITHRLNAGDTIRALRPKGLGEKQRPALGSAQEVWEKFEQRKDVLLATTGTAQWAQYREREPEGTKMPNDFDAERTREIEAIHSEQHKHTTKALVLVAVASKEFAEHVREVADEVAAAERKVHERFSWPYIESDLVRGLRGIASRFEEAALKVSTPGYDTRSPKSVAAPLLDL
jgi:hypothetical protein